MYGIYVTYICDRYIYRAAKNASMMQGTQLYSMTHTVRAMIICSSPETTQLTTEKV